MKSPNPYTTSPRCSVEPTNINIRAVAFEKFKHALDEWALGNEYAPFVTKDRGHFSGATCYKVEGVQAGFAVGGDNELLGMFNGSPISGLGDMMIKYSVREGATHLSCFDGFLVELYKQHGFVESDRIEWKEKYKPDRWNYDRFGRPDVVCMTHATEL